MLRPASRKCSFYRTADFFRGKEWLNGIVSHSHIHLHYSVTFSRHEKIDFYIFMQINDLHKKHNCFRIEIPTFLLLYKNRTNKRPERSILASNINTANSTFNAECQRSSDLHSRDTQHRNNWWGSLKNRNSSLVWENNLRHLPNKIITAS